MSKTEVYQSPVQIFKKKKLYYKLITSNFLLTTFSLRGTEGGGILATGVALQLGLENTSLLRKFLTPMLDEFCKIELSILNIMYGNVTEVIDWIYRSIRQIL